MRMFNRKRLGILTLALVSAVAAISVVHATATWGPSRTTYTWNNPADHITFNSITDNPVWGDERQFLRSRDLTSPTSDYATQTQVHDGEDVVLEVYFHNNAASYLNLVAHNTTVKFDLPTAEATTITPTAYISSGDATPSQVFATADLVGSQPFTITYEPGTAKLYTNYVNGIAVSDSVAAGGATIGTYGTDGNVPGCGQFSGYVTIRVKVHMQAPPAPTFSATATATATANASAEATCPPGQNGSASASASATATATATATSTISQAAAQQQAQNSANQQAQNQANAQAQAQANAKAIASAQCSSPTVTPAAAPKTTVTAKSLPNTGAGDVAGIFTGVSAVGTAAHMFVTRRRK